MADYKWEVGNNQSTTYTLKDGNTTIGTIEGLRAGLLGEETTGDSITGINVGDNGAVTITSNDVLPANPTADSVVEAKPADSQTLTLTLGSNVTTYGKTEGEPEIKIVTSAEVNASAAKVIKSQSAGWATTTANTKFTYTAQGEKELASVSGIANTAVKDESVKIVNTNQIELGTGALGTGTMTLELKNGGSYTLKLADGVTSSKTAAITAANDYAVNVSSGTATAKVKYSEYWELAGDNKSITHTNAGTESTAAATVSNLSGSATNEGTKPNVIFDKNTKTFTLKNGALDTSKAEAVKLDDTGVTNEFKLAIYTKGEDTDAYVTEAGTKEDTDFEWKIDGVNAEGNVVTEGAVAAKATIQKVLDAGWTLTGDKTVTYSAEKTLTYATISGLNPETDEDDLPPLADITEAAATNTTTACALTLTKANFPTTTTTAVITLANETTDSDTAVKSNFNIQIAKDTINESAKELDEYEVANSSGTATVKQMIDEYCEAGTDDEEGKKLTYHAKQAAETALATVEGLNTDATIALKDTTAAAAAAIVVDPSSKKAITLKATAFPTGSTGATVTLTSTDGYKLALSGVTAPDQNSGAPTVVAGESGTFKVQQEKTAGWTLGTATTESETTTQEVTYSAPEAATLATITVTNGAAGIAVGNFTVSGTTVTVAKEALKSDNTTTVAIANEGSNTYKLGLGDGITKFGATNSTISLAVKDDSTDAGDKLAEVRQAVSDGWYIPTTEQDSANAGKIVYKQNGYNVLATVTGLANGAVYEANGSNNTVTLSGTDNKTITLKKAALPGATEAAKDTGSYTVTTLTNETGQTYKLAFGDDVTATDKAPNTAYTGTPVIGTVDENGNASITGALNEGWTLATAGDKITYTAATADTTVLATISGLKASAGSGIAFGTTADVNEYDKNVVYLTTDALADNGVTLENKTGGDFKLSLKDGDDAATKLGYAKNYAWTLNSTGTTATFKQGNEKGWTLASDGLSVSFNDRVDPTVADTTAATLLTVSGLKGSLTTNNDTLTTPDDFLDPTKSVVGTEIDGNFVGLHISKAYEPAVVDNPATAGVNEAKAAVLGKITLTRNVLGKGTMQLTGTDKDKYNFELFDDASTAGGATADTFVPSKAVDKYYWHVNGTTAIYKQATAEYWALDSTTGKKVTYNAQANKADLAKITGITSGLQAKQGDDFKAAQTAADANKTSYVITGSYVYATNEDSKAIEMTTDYTAANTNNNTPEVLGLITLYDDAVAATDVKFTSGSDKYRLTLDNDFTSTLAADTQAWEVTGTTTKTANYYNVYEEAGYKVTEKDSADDTAGKVIKFYAKDSTELLATITGLNKDVVISEDGASIGAGADSDFKAGIEVKTDGATVTTGTGEDTVETTYDAFVLSSNVLGTSNVALTNGTDQDYRLALDTTDAKVLTEATKAYVWRLEGTTAKYKNVTPTYYKAATDAMSINTTAEKEEKVYATITNLENGLVEKDGKIYAADDTAYATELLAVGEETDAKTGTKRDIITVNGPALNTAKELKLSNGTGSTYALVLGAGEDSSNEEVKAAGIDTTDGAWSINGTTAIYKANWTAGWLPNATETSLKYYNEGTGKEIFRITGLKSGLTDDAFSAVTVEAAPGTNEGNDYIELPDEVLGTTDVKIENANRQNGVAFDYGIKLGETDSGAAGTAIEGVKRWSLSGTTLSLNNIHDGHHEDEAVKEDKKTATTGISKTTIKYIPEAVDSTAIVTITNLASGLSLATPEVGSTDKIVNGRYEGDTPVDGILVNGKIIKLSKNVLTTTAANPTTLTNKTGALSSQIYKLDVDTTDVKDQEDAESFTVSGTSAILYKVKTAGYKWNSTEVTYLPEETGDKIATISGIASGLVVGTDSDKSAVGYIGETDSDNDGENDFVAAITYDNDYKFTIADKKALAPNKITVDDGTLEIASGVLNEKTNLAEDYAWKGGQTSGTYTYNKGTTAGWELVTKGEGANKTINYSPAAYDDTVVATVSGLKGGLKVGNLKDESGNVITDADGKAISYLLDSKGNKAVYLGGSNAITVTDFAVNAKDILLKITEEEIKDSDGNPISKDYSLALDKSTTTAGGVTTNDNTYVKGKTVTPVWAQDSKIKSTYTYTVTTTAGYDSIESPTDLTVNKVVYDDRIVYTKAGKSTATLTGLKTDLAISEDKTTLGATDQVVVAADGSTITVAKAALDEKTVTLKNTGSAYKLKLGDGAVLTDDKVWTIGNGTATYIQQYKADSYVKESDLKYNYTGKTDGKDVTLATITGLNKDITATKISEGDAETDYGIKADDSKTITEADADNGIAEEKAAVIELSDRRAFGTGNIVLKNQNGSNYRFYIDAKDNFGAVTYTADDPRWTFSKGTLTLSEGTSDKWDYKVSGTKTDYNTLAISKGKTTAVATVKGLATNLVLKTDKKGKATEGNYGLYAAVKEAEAGTLAEATDPELVVTIDTTNETNSIKLTSGALVASPNNNAKVTLTVPKATTAKPIVTDFALDVEDVTEATADDMAKTNESARAYTEQENKWSVTKGTATYHHTNSAGWLLDSTGKTFTYTSTAKTTNLLKISGLATTDTMTTLTGEADSKGNKADAPINDSAFATMTGITVNSDGRNDDGEKETVFTLTDATKLGGKNVTLSVTDKTNNYALYASESLAPQEYETKVTVDGKKGTVTLTDGISDGYVTPDETVNNKPNKNYGKTVTYSKEKPNKALFTISGLKTDGTTEGFTLASKVTTEADGANVNIKGDSVLKYDEDKKTISITDTSIFNKKAVSITGTGGYTFASIGTNDDADKLEAPIMIIKSGVINIVDRADEKKYAISTDGKKINYNTKNVDTILATIKGLNKDIGQKDGDTDNLYINTTPKAPTPTWSADTVGSVSFKDEDEDGKYTGTVTLKDGALNNANVTFTKGRTAEEGDFLVTLDAQDVMTEGGDWQAVTEWTVKNGTATYKTYDKAYYSDDEKGGFKYKGATKGTTYATITGLKADKDTAIAEAFNTSTKSGGMSANLSITKDMLAEKNIVLKNSTVNGVSGEFTIALGEDAESEKSALSIENDSKFVSGRLTATQGIGYLESSDTQITYLKTAKTKQTVAQLTVINTNATDITAAADGTITLNTDQLAGKNVTLTTTDLAKLDYKLELATGTKAPDEPQVTKATDNGGWANKGANVVYTGLTTAGYTLAESSKAINYTKAAEKPATLATIKNATLDTSGTNNESSVAVKGTSGKQTTLSNGLFAVTYTGDNIAGSADSDTITLTKGASVKGGKGDDNITLSSGKDTILYGNGDGNDIITSFSESDVIKLTGGKLTSVTSDGSNVIVKVGTGSITLKDHNGVVNIVDNKDKELWKTTATSSSDVLFADNNYSADAAALSDIVEPFKASYTPYDFEAGLDLVKQNSLAPAVTFTGEDKK